MPLRRLLPYLLLLLAAATVPARAQDRALTTFETGALPVGTPTLGADSNLYGTTSRGGNANLGTVYRLTLDGNITTLTSFTGPNGTGPTTPIVRGTDGNFYGTTAKGSYDDGTIYRVTPDGVFTTLFVFPQDGKYAPSALTLGPDGAFYGTLQKGGRLYKGSVFRFRPPGDFQTIASFTDDKFKEPTSPLLLGRDGFFYGTTNTGGSKIFRVTPAGVLTQVASIDYNTSGFAATSPLVEDAAGNLYGVFAGYFNVNGGIFRVSPAGAYTVLARFDSYYETGLQPTLALGADGSVYGTTPGTVFRLGADSTVNTLVRFSQAQGGDLTGLRLAPDGAFYGAAKYNYANGDTTDTGNVFRVTTAGAVTTLYKFNHVQGSFPSGGLLRAADGNFYGVTNEGGATVDGNVYRVTPTGVRTTLAEFNYANGSGPRGRLCPDAAGTSLYGVTAYGGSADHGTVFRVALDTGALSTVYTFLGGVDGSEPRGGLVRGQDGAFYGVTSESNKSSQGTVFRLTADGALTTLHRFNPSTEGYCPYPGLTVGLNGALYGVTFYGGANGSGTVFRVSSTGEFAVLASLPSGGRATDSPLTLGPDGNLYGLTNPGGSDQYGTIFRVTPSGAYTTVLPLGSVNLFAYNGGLATGPDGNLYGVAAGRYYQEHLLFRLTVGGVLTKLRGIPGSTQAAYGSVGAPVFGADGTLYGVSNNAVWHLPITSAADGWRQRYFGTAANSGNAADNADPDGDGVSNLLERAFGSNPLVPDTAQGPVTAQNINNGRLTLSARRGPESTDLTFTAEASVDLVNWSATDTTVLYDGAGFFQAQDTGTTGSRRFLRLRAARP